MQNVCVLQHTPNEKLGTIEDALQDHHVGFHYIQSYAGQAVPATLDKAAGLIIMGGPMGVYEQDRYPYLRDEMRLIESALKSQKPVLGVCLGSQLLASVLGAKVVKGEKKELGWHAVTLTEAAARDKLFSGVAPELWPFHWHGDVFPLPPQAVGLASSKQTPCQAFRFGNNAYGILFHLEVTAEQISQMLSDFAGELRESGGSTDEISGQVPKRLPDIQRISRDVYGRWASSVSGA